jgi:hypothetical protein
MKQIVISGKTNADLVLALQAWIDVLALAHMAEGSPPQVQDQVPEPEPAAKAKKPTRKVKKPAPPAEPEVTRDDLREAVQSAIDTYGEAPVKEVFVKHKAKKFSDFKVTQFAAVIADLDTLAELASEDEGDDDDLMV